MQVSLANIKEILKIKEHFSQLLNNTVKEFYKIIINFSKPKPYINITIKGHCKNKLLSLWAVIISQSL